MGKIEFYSHGNIVSIRIFKIFLILLFILVSSIILSSAVSAADVTTMSQTEFHQSSTNNGYLSQIDASKSNLHTISSHSLVGDGNIIGRLQIPKLGVYSSIRSDTVNAYNAAYHYPDSASIGQSGQCGLMSHRTTYSALFRHLDWLKIGDKVILTDLKKTKYTYAVTSNGNDIR